MIEESRTIVQQKVKKIAEEYADYFLSFVKTRIDRKIIKSVMNFSDYLTKMSFRCNDVRVIIDRGRVYNLLDIYVGQKYVCGKEIFDDNDIMSKAISGGRFVILGLGGAGKTVFMKNVFLSMVSNKSHVLPVYIELRRINEFTTINLAAYARGLVSSESVFPEAIFFDMCKEGRFLFLLDGFDELPEDLRSIVEKQILSISFNYPKVGFIITSRFDDRFVSWERFQMLRTQPFEKEDVKKLLLKVDFDKEVRTKFIDEIVEKNFSNYKSFLEVPLLALMMLSTYSEFAEIPDRLHVFYRYAFQTLYKLHDASKEGFRRSRRVDIGEDELIKLVSTFCLLTYIRNEYSFSHEKFLSGLDEASKRSRIKVDIEAFAFEITESINLFYRDGGVYTFIHRSFQEYFTSLSLINYYAPQLPKALYKLCYFPGEKVISMMSDINRDVFEQSFVIPEHGRHKEYLKNVSYSSKNVTEVMDKSGCFLELLTDIVKGQTVLRYASITSYEEPFAYINIINKIYRKVEIETNSFNANVKQILDQYKISIDIKVLHNTLLKLIPNNVIELHFCSIHIFAGRPAQIYIEIANAEGSVSINSEENFSNDFLSAIMKTKYTIDRFDEIKKAATFAYRKGEAIHKSHAIVDDIMDDIFSGSGEI